MKIRKEERSGDMKKVALICSSGGHFFQLYALEKFWRTENRFWVTFSKNDTMSMLKDERVFWAHQPTNRNFINFIKNLFLAVRLLRAEKPSLLISTGAGVAVPFIYVARFLGIKTIYLESITRIKGLSLSGRLVYFFVNQFLVQWPELARKYRKAKFIGQVI